MSNINRTLAFLLSMALILSASAAVGSRHFVFAQVGTTVSGTINSDVTWTPSGNPYYLNTDLTIAQGATLTIESGVTVDFTQTESAFAIPWGPYEKYFTYNMQVNGAINAVGVTFSNEEGDTTFYLENSKLSSIFQNDDFEGGFYINAEEVNVKIAGNIGQPSVSVEGGTSTIEDNLLSNVNVDGTSPNISNNTMVSVGLDDCSSVVSNNTFESISVSSGSPFISGNTVSGGSYGYGVSLTSLNDSAGALFSDNYIKGSFSEGAILVNGGSPLIERNFVIGGPAGIVVYGDTSPLIENNTLAEDTIGINIYDASGTPSPAIKYNNFEQNSQYNIYLGQQSVYGTTAPNVDAAYNWWGTTDLPSINQTIFDHKNNFNLGTVTYTPVLNAPNPEATPNPAAPIDTQSATSTTTSSGQSQPQPSQQPSQQQPKRADTQASTQIYLYGAIAVLTVLVAALSAIIVNYRRELRNRPPVPSAP